MFKISDVELKKLAENYQDLSGRRDLAEELLKARIQINNALFHVDEFSSLGLVEGVKAMGDRVWGKKGISAVAKAETERDEAIAAREVIEEAYVKALDDLKKQVTLNEVENSKLNSMLCEAIAKIIDARDTMDPMIFEKDWCSNEWSDASRAHDNALGNAYALIRKAISGLGKL